ncbi:MAG: TRAP transporter large permease subunit [Deltaproteobacteria bacterium]|nr:TRAP transporter large permease subunit [Deltaproteobacteria bacterium]
MSPESIGLIGFVIMFVFLFMGMPIGFCMAFIGFMGEIFLFGFHGAVIQLGMVPYATVASFVLCVLPLFMLMGDLTWASGLTTGLYNFVYKVLGRLPGGLAMSTIGACGIFAACTGSSLASAATMTKIALPEMRRYNYDPALATGSIAAGGTLGILIPPSSPMIVYSVLTGASIGKLFIAGIIPGMLLVGLFMLTIYILTRIKPSIGPPGERSGFHEIITEGKGLWPALVLIVVVFAGLWGGVFSASEAGAVGAFISMLIMIGRKGFHIKEIVLAVRETVINTAMIFMIIIGALIFGDYMTASNLPALLIRVINDFSLSPIMVVFILMVIYVILGALMDELAIMLITVPVILPSLVNLHIDMVWFGILFVINQQMGMILPPVGMIVFILAGMIPDIPMYTIYKGILPFAIAMFICIILIMIFPEIATFLPNSMIN